LSAENVNVSKFTLALYSDPILGMTPFWVEARGEKHIEGEVSELAKKRKAEKLEKKEAQKSTEKVAPSNGICENSPA
jgi:hypothetical protein